MNTLLQRPWLTRRVAAPRLGPQTRLAMPLAGNGNRLRFTEWLLLAVLAVAYIEAISAPLFGMQFHLTVLNHLPLLLMAPVLLLHMIGVLLNRNLPPWQSIFAVTWPLLLLGLYALAGSAVAKWEFGVRETFVTFGVYLLMLPLYAAAVPPSAERAHGWARALIAVWVMSSLIALAGELARFSTSETLHEIEYLVLSGFFVLFCVARSRWTRLLALVLLLAAAGVNQKLTGYIIAAMAVVHIVAAASWRRSLPQWRPLVGVTAALLSVVLLAVLTLLYFEYRQYLPSGNVDVRMKQYESSFRQIVASPIWGNGYTQGSGEAYTEFMRVMNIPTHSDLIDIQKHGGLIALTLFLWGYWAVFKLVNRAVKATVGDRVLNAYFVGVRFFQVTAMVTFAINPLLLKGPFLVVIWGNLGLALGLALAVTKPRALPGALP